MERETLLTRREAWLSFMMTRACAAEDRPAMDQDRMSVRLSFFLHRDNVQNGRGYQLQESRSFKCYALMVHARGSMAQVGILQLLLNHARFRISDSLHCF